MRKGQGRSISQNQKDLKKFIASTRTRRKVNLSKNSKGFFNNILSKGMSKETQKLVNFYMSSKRNQKAILKKARKIPNRQRALTARSISRAQTEGDPFPEKYTAPIKHPSNPTSRPPERVDPVIQSSTTIISRQRSRLRT